ncbi:MAG: SAM-dependent methyltransferase [Planctomycetaceae bacterium]|nr:SAM-dependent methyltransferase [Planctomycetaceae bacterium]
MSRLFGTADGRVGGFLFFLYQKLLELSDNAYFVRWRSAKRIATGGDVKHWEKSADAIFKKFKISDASYKNSQSRSEKLIFALETYFSLIIESFLSNLEYKNHSFSANIYHWWKEIAEKDFQKNFASQRSWIAKNVARMIGSEKFQNLESGCDLFGNLYASILPTSARKQLGEFYTPSWLAKRLLDFADFDASGESRLLDPACGSGTFLLAAICRMVRAGQNSQQIAKRIAGYDVNPIAVLMTTANVAFALREEKSPPILLTPTIRCYDSIQNLSPFDEPKTRQTSEKFDYVVGNPPWLTWDKLPADYRKRTESLWRRYGLFNLSGKEARYGGAKKELAQLMIASASENFLKPHGKLAMVLPQTIFQNGKNGEGFRRFGGVDAAYMLRVLRVDDFSAFRVFSDASTKAATIVFENGKSTEYPVSYFRWLTPEQCETCQASPIVPERGGSAWQILSQNTQLSQRSYASKPSDYRAILGANTGGANGVYWVEILAENANGNATIRNLAQCGKLQIPAIETEIESGLLYPLLRWKDVKRYSAVPSAFLILAQDAQKRVGLSLETMTEKYPKTLAYLRRFETLLRNRAAFQKFYNNAPFYSMYNVSTETAAPIKVVWRRMDSQIRAAVVQSAWRKEPCVATFRFCKPIIPQETCSMIAAACVEEANYLAAMLNSAAIQRCAAAFSVKSGKGFGSPGMLNHLPIFRFDPQRKEHQTLAELGAFADKHCGRESDCANEFTEIAAIAESLISGY